VDPAATIPIDPGPGSRLTEALAAGPPTGPAARQELLKAAKDFESVLLERLFQEMKRTIPESGLLGGTGSGQVWDLFWSQLARDVASRGGLGLYKQVLGQLGAAPPADGADAPAPADTETAP